MANHQSDPLPPPFPVGTKLLQVGPRLAYTERDGERVWLNRPGLEVVVSKVRLGHRGTGRHLEDEDGPMYYEDTGEPIVDQTQDGSSIYLNPVGMRAAIHPDVAGEWEVVE